MSRTACRLAVLAIAALAVSASVGGTSAQAWAPGANGNILYTSYQGHSTTSPGSPHVWVIRPDGTNKRQLTTGNDAWPSWSPDGRKIVFSRQSDDGETLGWRIWEMNADGSGQHPITPPTPGTDPNRGDNMPRFSPDGTTIAFIETRPGSDPPDAQIWVMSADGSDPHAITDLSPTHIYAVGWAPDSENILFSSDSLEGPCEYASDCRFFYEMSAGGANLTQLTARPNFEWESFDYAPGHLASAEPTCFAGSGFTDVPDCYTIWGATGADASTGAGVGLAGDNPSFAPDAAATGDLAFVGCAGSQVWHNLPAPNGAPPCNYQVKTGSVNGGAPRQLTFDASNHYSPSWGPLSPALALKPTTLTLELPPQLGTPTIPVLVYCRSTSQPCRFKLSLAAGSSSRSMTFSGNARASRLVRLQLPKGARAGSLTTITLRTTIGGQSSSTQVTSRVQLHASLSAACPAPPAGAGSKVELTGKLVDSSPVGAALATVATSPDGRALVVKSTTGKSGSYSAAFVPDTPGLWQLQTTWGGDAIHPFTSSPSCGVMVPPPPPAKSALNISCPSGSAFDSPLQITGSLSPAFAGARITLEYSHPRKGLPTEKLTTTVLTSAKGDYSDGSVVADDIGEWDVTAFYNGDAADQPATSTTCAVAVS